MSEALTLESLGLTNEELAERVVDNLTRHLLDSEFDSIESRIHTKIKECADESVAKFANEHVLGRVDEYIAGLVLQGTNQWGEAKGEPMTFVEYLVKRAAEYMTEKVNFHGKTQKEEGYNWRGSQTRLAYMIDSHLQYSIKRAMKAFLKEADTTLANGILGTVKAQLAELQDKIRIQVKS